MPPGGRRYRGRFAPSPTGPLHAGSLVAALASWLDARAHDGIWLVRMEDVDSTRCIAGADQTILQQLQRCGLVSDEPVLWQTGRTARYQQALDKLVAHEQAYPCACSRKDIEQAQAQRGASKPRHGELVYPGTCRSGLHGRAARAWRFRVPDVSTHSATVQWHDRRLGLQQQDVAQAVGDFVLRRADGLFAYQLAVVVDDAEQGVTDVVRGEDLADNTARQRLLQDALQWAAPSYLHTPLVYGAHGEKLSKQNGAQALDLRDPALALCAAARVLQLDAIDLPGRAPAELLSTWVAQWKERWL